VISMPFFTWFAWGALASAGLCALLVATRHHHGQASLDSTIGVQKFHHAPTPRVGGVALYLALLLVTELAPPRVGSLLMAMLLSAMPAFLAGLLEDVTKGVSVRKRLAATFVSGLLAFGLTGMTLERVDVPGLDWLLGSSIVASVLFTAFAVSGASNAFNIVDGFNGLAGGAALIALLAMGFIAWRVGDDTVVLLCMAVACGVLGFMALNFPLGKIFLGDGGAYLLGFLVAWIAVMLPARNPAVSVWAMLLACGYPILETLFSIVRKVRRGHSPGHPDSVHLHMLLHRRVTRRALRHCSAELRNGLTSPPIWLFALLPASAAMLWHGQDLVLAGCFVLCALVYRAIYLRLTQFRWCFSTRVFSAATGADGCTGPA